jgi:hypothetical protein
MLLFYYKAKMTPEILNSTFLLKRKTGRWLICPFAVYFNFPFYLNKNAVELKKSYFQ